MDGLTVPRKDVTRFANRAIMYSRIDHLQQHNLEENIMRTFVDLAEKLQQIVRDHDETLSRQESDDLMVAVAFLRELWDAADIVNRHIGGVS